MSVPSNVFAPVGMLFMEPPDSEFFAYLCEAQRLLEREPGILSAIEADLELHGKRKKALRLQDAQWWQARSEGLPTIGLEPLEVAPEALRLGVGRTRTPASVVYLFLAGRGYFGGFKSSEATTLLLESVTLRVFLANQGMDLPGRSTLTELVNAVSSTTHERILDAQLRVALGEGWDDFSKMLQDSTTVDGNTQWPKDSRLLVDLLGRLLRRGGNLEKVGLRCWDVPRVAKLLGAMSLLDKSITMGTDRPCGARERRRLYVKLLRKARRATALVSPAMAATVEALEGLDVAPSVSVRAERLVAWMQTDLANVQRVIECCEARVIRGEKVAVQDKVLSMADPDVGFIAKGGRESVVGYKPQLARSAMGFVTGLIVPQGNAADSGQLVPMFDQVVRRTGVVPKIVSVDDGYSSREGRAALLARGVEVMSISGSKGKWITPSEDWDSEAYATARDDRSAVESLMFTIKHGFDFGSVARRGLENVRAELMEKVLAYNFCRLAACRRAARDHALAA